MFLVCFEVLIISLLSLAFYIYLYVHISIHVQVKMHDPGDYLVQVVVTFFVCLQIAFCSVLLAWLCFTFPTLLTDIQRPNWKSSQGPYPVGRVIYIKLVHHLLFYFNYLSSYLNVYLSPPPYIVNVSKCTIYKGEVLLLF